MKIASVAIFNFLSIGEATFKLDDQGLVLIQGVNKDNTSAMSNGAGKSSLVDAVMWCLYGETARAESTDKLIRTGAKKTEVLVGLIDEDGTTYSVQRERTKAKMSLRLYQSASVEITLGTAALTQARIIELLGCSAEVFRAGVYLGQEQMPDLPRMTDKRLKELIEEAAGLSVIEACYERARAEATAAERALQAALAAAKTNGDLIVEGDHMVTDAEQDSKEWSERQLSRILECEHTLGKTRITQADVKRDLDGLKPAADAAYYRLGEIVSELSGYNTAKETHRKAQLVAAKADGEVIAVEGAARLAIRTLKEKEAHHAQAIAGERCDACGQDIPEEHRSAHIHDAEEGVAAARREALQAAERVKAARQQAEQARSQAAACERAVPDVTALQEEAQIARETIASYERVLKGAEELDKEIMGLEGRLGVLNAESNPCKPAYDRAVAHVGELRTKAIRLHEGATKLAEEFEIASGVVAVFGPSGVRAEILDQVTPYLNARTAAYLDALSDGTLKAMWTTIVRDAKGNPREKFSIEITHPAGEGFGALSGGEKRKVRLATALALQDLVASRATKPMNLFIADEIDDALDEAGLERLMGVLGEKAREKGTVVVISHNSLTDWIPNTWTVTKAGGVASLETV